MKIGICRLCPNCHTIISRSYCDCGYIEIKEFIGLDDYFRCYSTNPNHPAFGRDFRDIPPYLSEITAEIVSNAERLVQTINSLFTQLEIITSREVKLSLTSGFRPVAYSQEIGLGTRSLHTRGLAVDISDIGNKKYDILASLARENTPNDLLAKLGLWMEDKSATRTWLHLDLGTRRERPVRIFLP